MSLILRINFVPVKRMLVTNGFAVCIQDFLVFCIFCLCYTYIINSNYFLPFDLISCCAVDNSLIFLSR